MQQSPRFPVGQSLHRHAPFLTIPLLGAVLSTGLAHAEIEEVVVTADFRDQSQMKVPNSVSVIGEQMLKANNAEQLEDMADGVPNLNYSSGTGRARFFQIRGIGERSQFVDPINPSVGILLDGVDMSGIGSAATLFDIEQVEVLRGPQGTRYGANALAGLINLKSNEPTDTFESGITTSFGNYETRSVGGFLSGPLSDLISSRLAVQKHQSNGYTENAFLGTNDVNMRDETTLRGTFDFNWNDVHETTLRVFHVDVDNGYDVFSLDNTRVTLSDEPGQDKQITTAIAVVDRFSLSLLDLELYATISDSDLVYGYDEDWTYVGIHPFGYSSYDNYARERDARSFEVRALSNDESLILGGTTEWVVGLYAFDSEEHLDRTYSFLPSPFASDYAFTTLAIFFESDSHLTNRLTLIGGLRLEKRSTTYSDSDSVAFNPDESLWGGRLGFTYDVSNALMYITLSRGYKAGGFNTDGTLPVDLRQFDTEYLLELETGIKGNTENGLLQYRLAVFYDLRRDQQVKSSIVRPRGDGTTEFIDFVGNAAEGRNVGLEIETNWFLSNSVALNFAGALLNARFDKFINEFGDDLSGRDQAQAPRYMTSVGINTNYGPFFANVSLSMKDDYFFSDRHSLRSTGTHLVNARVGYAANHWSIALWGRNLLDDEYTVRGFGSFGNDPRKNYITEPYVQFGEPKIIGLTFDFNFQ